MYLIREFCITFGSISKEGPYDLGFFNRSRFKAHAVVEDETWILDGVILMGDDRTTNAIMGDINGGLQSFQR